MEEGSSWGSGDEKEKKKKIISALVVDDEAVVRYIHMSLLRKLNVEQVEAAENGKAAVDAFQRGASFDLVLMDLEMPLMDGAQVINYTFSLIYHPIQLLLYISFLINLF